MIATAMTTMLAAAIVGSALSRVEPRICTGSVPDPGGERKYAMMISSNE